SAALRHLHSFPTRRSSDLPVISHFNLFRSVELDGSAARGQSSGQAIQKMEELSKKILPQGYTFSWTGLSLEEIESGGQVVLLFADRKSTRLNSSHLVISYA